jgi:hypothetical protein
MTKMKKFYSADILTHEEVLLNTKAITSIKDVPWCKALIKKWQELKPKSPSIFYVLV